MMKSWRKMWSCTPLVSMNICIFAINCVLKHQSVTLLCFFCSFRSTVISLMTFLEWNWQKSIRENPFYHILYKDEVSSCHSASQFGKQKCYWASDEVRRRSYSETLAPAHQRPGFIPLHHLIIKNSVQFLSVEEVLNILLKLKYT